VLGTVEERASKRGAAAGGSVPRRTWSISRLRFSGRRYSPSSRHSCEETALLARAICGPTPPGAFWMLEAGVQVIQRCLQNPAKETRIRASCRNNHPVKKWRCRSRCSSRFAMSAESRSLASARYEYGWLRARVMAGRNMPPREELLEKRSNVLNGFGVTDKCPGDECSKKKHVVRPASRRKSVVFRTKIVIRIANSSPNGARRAFAMTCLPRRNKCATDGPRGGLRPLRPGSSTRVR